MSKLEGDVKKADTLAEDVEHTKKLEVIGGTLGELESIKDAWLEKVG